MGDQRVLTALGITGESVMALYGIARLSRSRDLGPAQLLPPLDAYRADAERLVEQVNALFELLRTSTNGSRLGNAVSVLEPHANGVASTIAAEFGGTKRSKLGARDRLRLEKQATECGAQLESVRVQLDLLCAALHPQPVELVFADIVDGRWNQKPTFPSRRVEVFWDLRQDEGFCSDPRILWALFEAAFRSLSTRGAETLLVRTRADEHRRVEADIRSYGDATQGQHHGPLQLELGAPIPAEPKVAGAVAEHLHIDVRMTEADQSVTLAL